MNVERRIEDLQKLAGVLAEGNDELDQAIEDAYQHNKWFTKGNILLSLKNIREQFLDEKKIRKNRSSVAELNGTESRADLEKLGFDIFSYFGLGCRNVSKLFLPLNYSFDLFFQAIEKFRSGINDHNKYMNNYDYNRVLLLMN